jgi:chromate transport protein ChrA
VIVELFLHFLLISLLAFGGGQAALPLVEQVAVRDMNWVSASTFGAAVAFSYLTPGPVLIVAAFIDVATRRGGRGKSCCFTGTAPPSAQLQPQSQSPLLATASRVIASMVES